MDTNFSSFEKIAKDLFFVVASVFSFVLLFFSAQPGNFFASIPFVAVCASFLTLAVNLPKTPLFNVSKTIIGLGFVLLSLDYFLWNFSFSAQHQFYFLWFAIASLTPGFFQLKSTPFQYFLAISLLLQTAFLVEMASDAFWITGFLMILPVSLIYALNRKFHFANRTLLGILSVNLLVCASVEFIFYNNLSYALILAVLSGYISTFLFARFKVFNY